MVMSFERYVVNTFLLLALLQQQAMSVRLIFSIPVPTRLICIEMQVGVERRTTLFLIFDLYNRHGGRCLKQEGTCAVL